MTTTDTARRLRDDTALVHQSFTDESPAKTILRAFAELDVDLVATEERLADVVDPDALDRLLRTASGSVRLSMVLWGYPVVVTTDAVRVFTAPAGGE